MENMKCDICGCKLTQEEEREILPYDYNVCCEKHKIFRGMYQRDIAKALAGIDNGIKLPYTLEQLRSNMLYVYNEAVEKFKTWFGEFPRTDEQVLDYFRRYSLPLHPDDLIKHS